MAKKFSAAKYYYYGFICWYYADKAGFVAGKYPGARSESAVKA